MKTGDIVNFHEAPGTTVPGQALIVPAIVTAANADETLNLVVFHDGCEPTAIKSVGHNDDTGAEQYGYSTGTETAPVAGAPAAEESAETEAHAE